MNSTPNDTYFLLHHACVRTLPYKKTKKTTSCEGVCCRVRVQWSRLLVVFEENLSTPVCSSFCSETP